MTDFLKIAKSIVVHFAHICAYGVETVNTCQIQQNTTTLKFVSANNSNVKVKYYFQTPTYPSIQNIICRISVFSNFHHLITSGKFQVGLKIYLLLFAHNFSKSKLFFEKQVIF